jgi:hypothetical protein
MFAGDTANVGKFLDCDVDVWGHFPILLQASRSLNKIIRNGVFCVLDTASDLIRARWRQEGLL